MLALAQKTPGKALSGKTCTHACWWQCRRPQGKTQGNDKVTAAALDRMNCKHVHTTRRARCDVVLQTQRVCSNASSSSVQIMGKGNGSEK
eukprot:1139105-Pelagomonas_calceolata.AAC.4